MHFINIFSQMWLSSHSLNSIFHRAEIFNFSQFQTLSYLGLAFDIISKMS